MSEEFRGHIHVIHNLVPGNDTVDIHGMRLLKVEAMVEDPKMV